MKIIILIYCVFVQSLPVISQRHETFNYESENKTNDNVKKSVTDGYPLVLQGIDNLEEPSRLSLPTLEGITIGDDEPSQDLYDDLAQVNIPMDVKPPMIPLPLLWTNWVPYDTDSIQYPRYNTYGEDRYQIEPYSFADSIHSIKALPLVQSTQIHETIPNFKDNYEDNEMDVEDEQYFTPYVRAVRSRDDFIDQLKHDAMIPNIIPTMPVPFVRNAVPVYQALEPVHQDRSQVYQVVEPVPQAPLRAVFQGQVPECAVPFLFSCSPKIVYGSLVPNNYKPYGGYPQLAPSAPAYRGQVEEDDRVHHVHAAASCPPGEELGTTLQCIIRWSTTQTNLSSWNDYE